MNRFTLLILYLYSGLLVPVYSQNEQKYSAVNPALFLYTVDDVYIKPLEKYDNGKNIIKPDPAAYPWEARLENGMPNVVRDQNGNLSIYISSFISFAAKPPSKVGALVYTNNTTNIKNWQRPDAGLYWYNPSGATADEKISSVFRSGFQSTNIIAVDIESLGIYDDYEITNKPIKLIYLPQRESENKMIAGYEMDKTFTDKGILSGFSTMKNDRVSNQKKFIFKFINGDTHMNYLKQNGKYYFVSRLNAKRSALKAGETLPLKPDNRKRYRRETITEVGSQLVSKDVDFNIALDMSTTQWEPYSMQPVRLPGFENDIWWGLVTMFGTEGDEQVQHKQRTELAISNDGVNWRYLKPGTPFLDNGTDPQSDDYGCINIAKPILNTRFSSNPLDVYYFYAASNVRHIAGRNPGISLALGKYGKMAGLKADQTPKKYYSMEPTNHAITVDNMPKFSFYNAFKEGGDFFPYILADVTDDPRGKMLTQLNSYVAVLMYSYDPNGDHGKGKLLGGTLGSSVQGSQKISDNYEAVGFSSSGMDGNSKEMLLEYLKSYSELHPQEIVSIKNFPEIPVVFEATMKNSVLYGIKFKKGNQTDEASVDLTAASNFEGGNLWSFKPPTPSSPCHTENFGDIERLPNQKLPIEKEIGSIALKVKPKSSTNLQTIMRMAGDDDNNMSIYYNPSGSFQYVMEKDGLFFASMLVLPPTGKSFADKEVIVTLESVKNDSRKYGKTMKEESAVFRVSCPAINFDKVVQQDILFNWKHPAGSITAADSANARAFAYLGFSVFIAGMDKISVGGKNSNCDDPFNGSIYQVEVAEKLPSGSDDFWNNAATRSNMFLDTDAEADNMNNAYVNVYPNPIKMNETLQIEAGLEQDQNAHVELVDFTGRLLKSFDINMRAGVNNLNMDVQGVSPGNYILIFDTEEISVSRKIIIVD